uniref:C-type lectin domain family 1 member B-like n=1 Tax=Dromaius novaehollandiae TaxID=8790 RepID=A0A8C4JZR8_DRONO|nr:C-type lectin domain family 1 member B-like isoform X2 [Dromaius novaehollandiae]
MTEEVTYANLKFENCHVMDNITEPEDTKEKGHHTSSCSWWSVVLILFTLFLALLMGLVTLTVLFFQCSKEYRTQIRELNMTKNDLHANFSDMLQAIGNQLCLEGDKTLKNNGQNCVLCPANWRWEGGDTCYYFSTEEKTWEQSDKFCSSQNSTLLLIKEKAKWELVKQFDKTSYWLGLSFRTEQNGWFWADNTALKEEQRFWARNRYSTPCCAYLYYKDFYCQQCKEKKYYVCEKLAIQLERGNNHQREDWFVRPK